MKLELKNLAIAFSNNQKVLYYDDERCCNQICRISALKEDTLDIFSEDYQYNDVSFDDVKIVARPLSDLTKEIEVNGEKFVASEKLGISKNTIGEYAFIMDDGTLNWAIWAVNREINCLFEWHFDVYGLIEQNLAIDINTLNN